MVHHSKKEDHRKYRGNSSLFNAMDTVWCMSPEDNKRPARVLELPEAEVSGEVADDIHLKFERGRGHWLQRVRR